MSGQPWLHVGVRATTTNPSATSPWMIRGAPRGSRSTTGHSSPRTKLSRSMGLRREYALVARRVRAAAACRRSLPQALVVLAARPDEATKRWACSRLLLLLLQRRRRRRHRPPHRRRARSRPCWSSSSAAVGAQTQRLLHRASSPREASRSNPSRTRRLESCPDDVAGDDAAASTRAGARSRRRRGGCSGASSAVGPARQRPRSPSSGPWRRHRRHRHRPLRPGPCFARGQANQAAAGGRAAVREKK